jgi:hypothetical protein
MDAIKVRDMNRRRIEKITHLIIMLDKNRPTPESRTQLNTAYEAIRRFGYIVN